MNAIGLAEIADRTLLESGGWSVVLTGEDEIDATVQELQEELRFLLDEEGIGSIQTIAATAPETSFVDQLARLAPGEIALVPLRARALPPVAKALDYARGRLNGAATGVIITSETGVRALAAEAPSFWSWVGPRVWTVDRTAGQLDAGARLASLRQGTGLTDAEVVARAEAGTLSPEPVFAEWLVLLGRGDLLGH